MKLNIIFFIIILELLTILILNFKIKSNLLGYLRVKVYSVVLAELSIAVVILIKLL